MSASWIPPWLYCPFLPVLPDVLSPEAPVVASFAHPLVPWGRRIELYFSLLVCIRVAFFL
jgi:hypothetical protein